MVRRHGFDLYHHMTGWRLIPVSVRRLAVIGPTYALFDKLMGEDGLNKARNLGLVGFGTRLVSRPS